MLTTNYIKFIVYRCLTCLHWAFEEVSRIRDRLAVNTTNLLSVNRTDLLPVTNQLTLSLYV